MRSRIRTAAALLGLVALLVVGYAPAAHSQAGYPPGAAVLGVSVTNPSGGETITACPPPGAFDPNSQVRVLFRGQQIMTVTADAAGGLCAQVTIPCPTEPGPARLEFVGTLRGAARTVGSDLTIEDGECPAAGATGARGQLSRTGSSSTTPLTAAGVGLVLIGAVAVAAARRRRAAQSTQL